MCPFTFLRLLLGALHSKISQLILGSSNFEPWAAGSEASKLPLRYATLQPAKMIESQFPKFSKSREVPEDLRFLFIQIFLRIEHAYLGCGSIHRNGSKWPNYYIGENRRIVGWQLATLSLSPNFLLLLAHNWSRLWRPCRRH